MYFNDTPVFFDGYETLSVPHKIITTGKLSVYLSKPDENSQPVESINLSENLDHIDNKDFLVVLFYLGKASLQIYMIPYEKEKSNDQLTLINASSKNIIFKLKDYRGKIESFSSLYLDPLQLDIRPEKRSPISLIAQRNDKELAVLLHSRFRLTNNPHHFLIITNNVIKNELTGDVKYLEDSLRVINLH